MNAALILIDIQKGFLDSCWGHRCNPDFEKNIEKLISYWRRKSGNIFHIQHQSIELESPLRPSHSGVDFMDFAKPQGLESVFIKTVHSAFIGTKLEFTLRDQGIQNLVIVGLTSDHCVSTSARMAHDLGFNVAIPHDAVATFDRIGFDGNRYVAEEVQKISLASLHREFVQVSSVSSIVDGWKL